jgi:transcriptional regulator with GAF, ATPase, and Fis domain
MTKDWGGLPAPLRPVDLSAARIAPRHLEILRELLARDYLTRADWRDALIHLARMAREGLDAAKTLVALYDDATGAWTAVNSEGESLSAHAISEHGSRAILEEVRRTQEPLVTIGAEPLKVASNSVIIQKIHSVLAVPIHWWDVTRPRPQRRFGGCLYAHRTSTQPSFTQHDIALVLDITRIAEPNLNLLRYLKDLEEDLERQRETLTELRDVAGQDYRLGSFGTLDPMFARHVIGTLRRVARADKVGLVILGPTGSGKSHLAKAYHFECSRQHGPFITLDCSQVTSATTLTAELFGYAANSGYSNSPVRGRPGKAKLADGGTLFIDEIAALPADLQQKLLRLIQDGVFSPLGSSEEIHVDLQVIAATNEDLETLVQQGVFREDLYWRLCEINLHLPPLNERVVDIPALARGFLVRAAERFNRPAVVDFSEGAMRDLIRHDWSQHGNIRGLEHVVKRAVLMAPPGATRLEATDLHFDMPAQYGRSAMRPPLRPSAAAPLAPPDAPPPRGPSPRAPAQLKALLAAKVREHDANVKAMTRDPEVARALGSEGRRIAQSTLYAHLREHGLSQALLDQRERRRQAQVREAVEAIRRSGSGTAAADALGITRDTLVWRLRASGRTISDVLEEDDPE